MTVGQDTYITLEEAEEIIAGYLLSSDAPRMAWDALSDADKGVHLKQGLIRIDAQIFTGRKAEKDQALQFPRYGKTAVPQSVKIAQALEACTGIGISAEAEKRAQLQAQGIQSFSAGSLSETYVQNTQTPLFSTVAQRLLRPFITGGVPFA
jgi:hypothetical protein